MSTENIGDFDVSLDIEPFLSNGDNNTTDKFNIGIDVEQPDGSVSPVLISGRYAVLDTKRYILIKDLMPANTVVGNLQRRIVRLNGLRMVDKKLMDSTVKEIDKAKKSPVKRKK